MLLSTPSVSAAYFLFLDNPCNDFDKIHLLVLPHPKLQRFMSHEILLLFEKNGIYIWRRHWNNRKPSLSLFTDSLLELLNHAIAPKESKDAVLHIRAHGVRRNWCWRKHNARSSDQLGTVDTCIGYALVFKQRERNMGKYCTKVCQLLGCLVWFDIYHAQSVQPFY